MSIDEWRYLHPILRITEEQRHKLTAVQAWNLQSLWIWECTVLPSAWINSAGILLIPGNLYPFTCLISILKFIYASIQVCPVSDCLYVQGKSILKSVVKYIHDTVDTHSRSAYSLCKTRLNQNNKKVTPWHACAGTERRRRFI
jgi:hypothetical protein